MPFTCPIRRIIRAGPANNPNPRWQRSCRMMCETQCYEIEDTGKYRLGQVDPEFCYLGEIWGLCYAQLGQVGGSLPWACPVEAARQNGKGLLCR